MNRPSALGAVVTAAVTAATYLLMHYAVAPRLPVPSSEVPQLNGLTTEQARGQLGPLGLLLSIDGERPDEKAPPGTLVAQQPLAGSHLRRGSEVHAFLARAVTAATVPQLAGMTVAAAHEALEKAHLRPGNTTQASDEKVPAGSVVSSAPAAGASASPGAAVDLVVSSGPQASTVPSVIGKRLSKAKELLEQAGFAAGNTRYGSHDDYESGTVIKQTPAAGTSAPKGTKVDLTVND